MARKYANIYEYANYREYLIEYQKNRYAEDRTFSRNGMCQRLGLPNTKSYFRDVINGKNITKNFIDRFIIALELDKKEARYFSVLVRFTQAQTGEERDQLFEQLIALNQTPKRFIKSDAYAYYSQKHHSVIRCALDVYEVFDDYKFLGNQLVPPLPAKAVQSSLELLKRLHMAKQNKRGQWVQTEKNVSAGFCGKNEIVKQYQLGKLEQGKKALLSASKYKNQTLTMTVSISPDMLKKLEEKVEKFRSEVRSMIHKDEKVSQQIYQINLQYFAQSKLRKDAR